MSKFNQVAFAVAFQASIDALAQSETVTKRELMGLSRSVLDALHTQGQELCGDIQFINKLIAILTPVNKKVAIAFFVHFGGFTYDDTLLMFTKKSKKRYTEAFAHYVEFMADPNNNIWSWAERNIEIQKKAFDLSKVTDYVKTALKKASDAKLTQVDVMKAVLAAGMELDTIIAILSDMSEDKEATLNKAAEALGFDPAVQS